VDAADIAPYFLAMTIQIVENVGADRHVIELLQQAERGELSNRMRQCIDAYAKLADRLRLLEKFTTDAAGAQHQRCGKAANTATDDNRLHRCTPPAIQNASRRFGTIAWRLTRRQAALCPPT